jgi:hypothetical protein
MTGAQVERIRQEGETERLRMCLEAGHLPVNESEDR